MVNRNPYKKIKIAVVFKGTTIIHKDKKKDIKEINKLSKEIFNLHKSLNKLIHGEKQDG